MNVVIDASAIITVALQESEPALIAATRLALSDSRLLAPGIMPVEVAGALAMAEWIGRRSSVDTDAAWVLAGDIIRATELHATDDTNGLFAVCRRYRLRGADACYLKLSIERSAALLTGDKALASAALAADVPLVYDPNA